MSREMFSLLEKEMENLHTAGLFHDEYETGVRDQGSVQVDGQTYIDLTSQDYLGLALDPAVKKAAQLAIQEDGVSMGSQRFITGTHRIHQDMERAIANYFQMSDAALFATLYQANIGLFESLLTHQDFIFCDLFSHPSVVDGVQLTKAKKSFYARNDLEDLEDQLKRSPQARFRVIITEGVFGNDGQIAHLDGICNLADEYDAIVVVHDSHGVGVIGETGRGSAEVHGVLKRIDLLTASFGVALSGVELAFVTGQKDIIRWLKQKCKSYVFSTSPSPPTVAAARTALDLADQGQKRRQDLEERIQYFRSNLNKMGFRVIKSTHPIVGIASHDAVKTQRVIDSLYKDQVFAIGLCYPVVPKGFARIRAHITVSHSMEQLNQALEAFERAGKKHKILR